MSVFYKEIRRWWGQAIVITLAVMVSGCAARPYKMTNFFTSKAMNEMQEKRMAVIPFKNLSPIPEATDLLTDEFNLQLGKLGKFRLIERIRIQELFKEQDLDPERIDEATAVKIGKMLGANAIILGTVTTYYPYKYKEKKEAEEKEKKELERARIEAAGAPKTVVIIEQQPEKQPVFVPPGQQKDKEKGWEKDKDKEKEKDKEKDKDKDKDKKKEETEVKKDEGNPWVALAIVGGIILTAGILFFALSPKPTAEIGISVRMVNVETGEQLWQAKETFKGNDPRIQALVDPQDRDKLVKDVEFLSQTLCREFALTIEK